MMSTAPVLVTFHTCPVCRREVEQNNSIARPLYKAHRDSLRRPDRICPMSGEPIQSDEVNW